MEKLVVLLLNYKAAPACISYIKNLKQQKQVALSICVVDNCSPDNSFELLQESYKDVPDVHVLQSPYNGGYAYGNNFGLRYIRQKFDKDMMVLISNTDIQLHNVGLLRSMMDMYTKGKHVAFVAPHMYIDGKPAPNTAWRLPSLGYDIFTVVGFRRAEANASVYYMLPQTSEIYPVDCLSGAFFMGKLSTFEAIDYFDERTFLYEEERILAKKVKALGLQNYLFPNLHFHHDNSGVIRKELTQEQSLKHLLNSRIVYHRYHAKTHKIKVLILRMLYWTYGVFRKIKLLIKPRF